MSSPLAISYFSDILCVWAYIAELRNDELLSQWGDQIQLDCRYLDLFADTHTRIGEGWMKRGGYSAFGDHVREAARAYDLSVHEDVWNKVRPATSANAHLVIKAVSAAHGKAQALTMATKIRKAFFERAIDIGTLDELLEIARKEGCDEDAIRSSIQGGQAIAALLADTKAAAEAKVAGSPTWILNEGRQTLYGNVGYRVLHANVEELLRTPKHQASWC